MKKILFALLMSIGMAAQAAPLTIDPLTGLSGDFLFGGTVGTAQTDPADGWEITVASASSIDVNILDCCIVGDEFALQLDGGIIAWTTSNPGAGVNFTAFADDVFLSAGTHVFNFILTAACCQSGGGSYSFSAVSAAAAEVPEPTSIALLGAAMVGLVVARRKVA